MEETVFSLSLALTDFIPVALWAICALLLIRDLKNKMAPGVFVCLIFGTVVAFLAGFLKALWKLLIAVGVGNFPILDRMFLPLQSTGLMLTGLSIILMLALRKRSAALMAPLTLGCISMMVLGLGAMCTGLGILAGKLKKKALIPVFILCFFCYMGMGYLSSRGDNSASANWTEQGVNTLGQLLLLWGTMGLHKAGLRDYQL